jgi:hypothetical protein
MKQHYGCKKASFEWLFLNKINMHLGFLGGRCLSWFSLLQFITLNVTEPKRVITTGRTDEKRELLYRKDCLDVEETRSYPNFFSKNNAERAFKLRKIGRTVKMKVGIIGPMARSGTRFLLVNLSWLYKFAS